MEMFKYTTLRQSRILIAHLRIKIISGDTFGSLADAFRFVCTKDHNLPKGDFLIVPLGKRNTNFKIKLKRNKCTFQKEAKIIYA